MVNRGAGGQREGERVNDEDRQQATTTGKGARRHGGRIADIARSLAVVLAVVAVVVLLTPRPDPGKVRVVDWADTYRQAMASARYDVVAPRGLPSGWRATSARVDAAPGDGSAAWTVTFVTPADDYAALAQSDGDTASYVADMTKQGAADGSVRVGGQAWERRFRQLGREERRSLVRPAGRSVVLVTGTASWGELERLAGSLRVG